MDLEHNLPPIMAQAREDLAGNIPGHFSKEDWAAILKEAERRWLRHKAEPLDESEAWRKVIREFHQEKFWGFHPAQRKPRPVKPKKTNVALSFILLVAGTMTVTKIAVVWLGQVYSRSDEAADKWAFFAILAVVLANFGYFLWRHRHHED